MIGRLLIPAALVSQALTLVAFMARGSAASVVIFAAAGALEAFLVWMDRKRIEELDQLKQDMATIKQALDGVLMEAKLRIGGRL